MPKDSAAIAAKLNAIAEAARDFTPDYLARVAGVDEATVRTWLEGARRRHGVGYRHDLQAWQFVPATARREASEADRRRRTLQLRDLLVEHLGMCRVPLEAESEMSVWVVSDLLARIANLDEHSTDQRYLTTLSKVVNVFAEAMRSTSLSGEGRMALRNELADALTALLEEGGSRAAESTEGHDDLHSPPPPAFDRPPDVDGWPDAEPSSEVGDDEPASGMLLGYLARLPKTSVEEIVSRVKSSVASMRAMVDSRADPAATSAVRTRVSQQPTTGQDTEQTTKDLLAVDQMTPDEVEAEFQRLEAEEAARLGR